MRFIRAPRMAVLAFLGIPGILSAATVTVNQLIDLTVLDLGQAIITKEFHTSAPTSLAPGDTLLLNYSFLGGQTLIMNHPNRIVGWLIAGANYGLFRSTGDMSFIGLDGPAQSVLGDVETNGYAQFGNVFDASQFSTGPGPIEFSGLSFRLHVDSFLNGDTSRSYLGPLFMMDGGTYSIGQAPVAPEPIAAPGTLALLAGSLGLLGCSRRRCRVRQCALIKNKAQL